MKLRVGSSVLLLLQARAPATALSSPLSSFRKAGTSTGTAVTTRTAGKHYQSFHHPLLSSSLAFVSRGGGSGSNGTGSNNINGSRVIRKATISTEDSSTAQSNNNNNNNNKNSNQSNQSNQEKEAITKAALNSINITGPSTYIDTFAQIPFVNTSKLNSKPSSTEQQQQHRVLFILGGPGAGKGTQSSKIVDTYKCIHLSVGELLRKERTRGDNSPHADLIESCLVAGKIVPVEISLNLVRNAMDDAVNNSDNNSDNSSNHHYGQPIFLVDGFPRNYDNLSGWTSNMPTYATCIGSLVYDCPIDVLEQRILSRAQTSGRSDDNIDSARKRFRTFQEQTMPVVHALEEVELMQMDEERKKTTDLDDGKTAAIGKLHIHHIAADGTVNQVWDETKKAMDGYVQNDVLSANALLLKAIQMNDIETYELLTSGDMLELSSQDDIDVVNNDNDSGSDASLSLSSNDNIQEAFNKYETFEGCNDTNAIIDDEISNAQVDVRTGTKAIVSYDRRITITNNATSDNIKTLEFRESRVWSHESKGWVCIHFVRKPLN